MRNEGRTLSSIAEPKNGCARKANFPVLENEVIHLFFQCSSAVPGLPTAPGCLHIAALTGGDLSSYSNSVLSAKSTHLLAQTWLLIPKATGISLGDSGSA